MQRFAIGLYGPFPDSRFPAFRIQGVGSESGRGNRLFCRFPFPAEIENGSLCPFRQGEAQMKRGVVFSRDRCGNRLFSVRRPCGKTDEIRFRRDCPFCQTGKNVKINADLAVTSVFGTPVKSGPVRHFLKTP